MRKILTLCAAVLMALTANAKIWDITPTHCHEGERTDGYTLFVELDRGAQAGDTIRLADGEYMENQSLPVNNNVVIMAAEGAHPTVVMNGYFQIKASLIVEGIRFHCKKGGQGYCMYFYDNSAKYLKMKNCEFMDFTQYCVSSWEAYHIDSCIVEDCYFHDLAKAPFYFAASSLAADVNACDNLTVKNSTFANITLADVAVLDLRNNNNNDQPTSKLRVDHCTFYNCKGYERMIQAYKSPDSHVTNCIMANPLAGGEEPAIYAAYLYGTGAIDHCLYFQTKRLYSKSGVVADNLENVDPQFVDAANYNYTLGAGSPALTAGTDGKAIGDPRWVPEAKYYLKSNWDGSSDWTWKEMTKDGDNYKLEGVVIRGTGYNYSTKNDDPSPAYIEVKDIVNNPEYKDTVTLVFDPSAKTLTAENIKAYVRKNADGFYLAGDAKGWEPAAANLFTKNTEAVGDEYQLSTTLAEDEGIKVCESNKDDLTWYLDGMGNEYKVLAEQAGKVIIYFRPNHDGGEGWIYSGYLYIKKDTGTAIDNIDASVKTVKMIENGQLIIIKNGVKYNAIGEMVK